MKFCSTCQEEFADKFSFCPVDGTPLTAVAEKVEESVTRPAVQQAPVYTASEPAYGAVAAGAAATAVAPKGEYHLTFIDDTGVTQRLIAELKEVAHNSELTWPEFKRDPFGFSKRMVVGYGQAGWRVSVPAQCRNRRLKRTSPCNRHGACDFLDRSPANATW